MSQLFPSEPPFFQAITQGVVASDWVDGRITLAALRHAVKEFEAVRGEFVGYVAPVDWLALGRIVLMFSATERTAAHWQLTQYALSKVRSHCLIIPTDKHPTVRDVINVIKEQYDNAMAEIWCAPAFIPPLPISHSSDKDETESEEAAAEGSEQASNDDEPDHVIGVGGMRRINHKYLALALRAQTATRGANDDELKRRNLAFECPYFCKPDGNAAIIERSNNMTRHMQRVHGFPRGYRVTAVDTVGRQYQMAGRGEEEVLWKLVVARE